MRGNAVFIKELRSRMRGGRAFLTLTLYLLLLSCVSLGIYSVSTRGMNEGSGSMYAGITLFIFISFLQLATVSFLTPSFTVGAITKEKEQQTYELLVTTKMSSVSVITGKLVSAIAYILLLILASLPITSIVFLFGGVSVLDFVFVYLITLVTTIFFGSIGLFFSTLTSKTQFSTVLSYTVGLFFIVGTVIMAIFTAIMLLDGPNPNKELAAVLLRSILVLNPFYALGSVFAGTAPGPFSIPLLIGGLDASQANPLMPDWLYTVVIYLFLTLILLFLASEFIKPVNRWQIRTMPLLKRFVGHDKPQKLGKET